ncbi:MAG: APC family permease [Leucobacter sp.]
MSSPTPQSTAPETRTLDSVTGMSRKGLPGGSIGIMGAIVVGLSVCAPAYTLTSAVGPAASVVGVQTPAIFLIGFIPMLLVAFGYRALNDALPDSGTSFTWGTRAFGPWVGWMSGWGLIAATVLVLSNLAGIAVEFLFQSIGEIIGDPNLYKLVSGEDGNIFLNVLVCIGFLALATLISYRGMTSTKVFQYITVFFQVAVLLWFIIAMFVGSADPANTEALRPELSWFNPFAVEGGLSAVAAGIAVSIFVYWGWDTVLTMGEETKASKGRMSTASKASMILVVLLVVLYVGTATATVAFAGVGEGPTGLMNPAIQENVFAALAHPVMGPVAILLFLAILVSAMASINSTAISPARTLLAMAHYGAMPQKLKKIHPKYKSPYVALLASAIVAAVFYAIMRTISYNALWDTITSLGIMVCFYYGLTALSSAWYFRKTAFKTSAWSGISKVLMPGLGGLILLLVFVQTMVDSMDPDFGSGSSIGGLGLVFVLGVVVLLSGAVFMLIYSRINPDFFKGTVLRKGDDSQLTGTVETFDDGLDS